MLATVVTQQRLKTLMDKHIAPGNVKLCNGVIDGLTSIATSVVHSFNQQIVSDAKANGTFTAVKAAEVKAAAVQATLSQ